MTSRPKPTISQLGVDIDRLDWRRSGSSAGSFEIAFVPSPDRADVDWVLLRVAGDAAGRVLVYDRVEWLCFLDGVVLGEFG
ncbi:MAG TPA: hypothetical protein VNF47_12830 [Streptosporangiaceae bacterium]|nr:hypothetical protein [Streptosporangiaceae bacterium]